MAIPLRSTPTGMTSRSQLRSEAAVNVFTTSALALKGLRSLHGVHLMERFLLSGNRAFDLQQLVGIVLNSAMLRSHYTTWEAIGCISGVLVQHLLESRLIHTCMAVLSSRYSQEQTCIAPTRDMFRTSPCVWVCEGRSSVCSIVLTLIAELLQ
jgi:hypothetical protein